MDRRLVGGYREMRLQVIAVFLVALLARAFSGASAFAQDYRKIFEKEWIEAERYVVGQWEVWDVIFPEFGIRTELAVAVIFPELVRYSALRDYMETAAVKALYLQKGVRGADFSIGRFQMKPSFAEDMERAWMRTEWSHEYEIYFDLSETLEARRSRILRLDDRNWQCIYLAIFLRLLYRRFPRLREEEDIEQVRFCATAYNASYYGTYEAIRRKSARRFYYTDFIPTKDTKRYAYSGIAVCFYKEVL